jgi:small GTP-binding protein
LERVIEMSDTKRAITKIVLLGDGAVGKTSLQSRFTKGIFREDYKMTVGFQYAVKEVDMPTPEGTSVPLRLHIWDLAGQSRFDFLRPMFIENAKGCVLVYDVTRRETFEGLREWIQLIKEHIQDQIPTVLVGNKTDLSERAVTNEEAKSLAKELGIMHTLSSAKTGDGVADVFMAVAALVSSKA